MPIGPDELIADAKYEALIEEVEGYLDSALPLLEFQGDEKRILVDDITRKCACTKPQLRAIEGRLREDYLQAGWHKLTIACRGNGTVDLRSEENVSTYLILTR